MKVKTAAKINLALDVIGRLENGYHSLESVFQTVGLYDEVTVETNDTGAIKVSCELPEFFEKSDPIPCDERNIAYKAAKRFFEENGMDCGCSIHIKKGIPSQAGMGGGSTDAAAVLYCLAKITGRTFSSPEKLGADVPFFLTGGTAYVSGIGEKIESIADFSGRTLVIAKGREGVSTAEAYSLIDALEVPDHPQTSRLVSAIESEPDKAYEYFGNLFEQAIKLEEVDDIEKNMRECGALNPKMTGSGSAVFGLFTSREQAENCAETLRNSGYFADVCETVDKAFIEL